MKICSVVGCGRKNHAHGYCSGHVTSVWIGGNPKRKAEALKKQRERRAAQGDSVTKKYEKTPNGYLMRMYRNMKSRVTGIQYKKAHLYLGKELLSKEDFYIWAKPNPSFLRLYKAYVKSNYDQRLAPTVDRIDSSIGYRLDNMRWLTHSDNSRLGSINRFSEALDASNFETPTRRDDIELKRPKKK